MGIQGRFLDASGSTRQPKYNPFRGTALRHLAARARRQMISAFEPLILLRSPLTNFGLNPRTKFDLRKIGRGIEFPHQNWKIGRGIPSPRFGEGIGNALGQEESDMKDSEFDSEALAVLRGLVTKIS